MTGNTKSSSRGPVLVMLSQTTFCLGSVTFVGVRTMETCAYLTLCVAHTRESVTHSLIKGILKEKLTEAKLMRRRDLLESLKHTIPTRNIRCRLGQWIEQARHNTTTRGRERRNQRGDTGGAKPHGEFAWHKPRGSIGRITTTRNPGNPKARTNKSQTKLGARSRVA